MEITLYNQRGEPQAYIADDTEHSIYLWNGHAVAYIKEDVIHGWNGKHLGWFIDGIIYDTQGYRVSSIRNKCPVATFAEPVKYAKYAKYAKYVAYAPYAKPRLSTGYSDQDLLSFLEEDKV